MKRCIQLASDLHKKNTAVLLCLEHDPKSMEIIKESGLDHCVLDENNPLEKLLQTQHTAKVIVLDLLNISAAYTQKIKAVRPEIKMLALDYFDMLDKNVDTIINLYNHNKTYGRPVSDTVRYLEGPGYGILRDEFNALLANGASPKKQLKNILITFGGSDPRNYTLLLIPVLEKIIGELEIRLTIVIGPNFTHAADVAEAAKKTKLRHALVYNPPGMALLMKEADLCICGSGTTILELSALGTPAIIIPQSAEELGFSGVFEAAGFAVIAGLPGSIDVPKLGNTILRYYHHTEELEAAGNEGPKLCDGRGKEKIIQELYTLLTN